MREFRVIFLDATRNDDCSNRWMGMHGVRRGAAAGA